MATGEGKVPIRESALAGWRFMRSSLMVVAPAAGFIAVFNAAAQTLMDPAASPNTGLGWGLYIIAVLGTVAYTAFLLRLALREDASGFFGLKAGAEEGRVLGVGAAIAFLFIIMGTVSIFVVSLPIAASMVGESAQLQAAQTDPAAAEALVAKLFAGPGGLLFAALLVFLVGLFAWVAARLSLASAATIGEGRMLAFSTFAWTRGNALRILAVLLVLAAPLAFATALGASLIGALIGAAFGDTDAVFTAKSGALMAHALFLFVAAFGQLLVVTPAIVGAQAYLYKGLRPADLAA
jgi:hypothetical protein